ncbi:hypothetical protein Tco_0221105 [Tanacetum coccineum]
MSFSRFFFPVTLIASSSSKSSFTKGDILEGGGVSSNVTLSDSLTFLVTQPDLELYLQYKTAGEEYAPQMAPVESPHVVSSVKLPILKKGEYTLWSMRMEQYLTNTDFALWQVIMNGDKPVQTTKDDNGIETEVPLKTAQAILARQKERKAKNILLLAFPDEYQLRFHTIKDVKSLWAAIRVGFNEDANKKFLRALPLSWNNIALIMRNKEGIDELDIDDLYNNLKVFEADIKAGHSSPGQASSSLYADDIRRGHFARECRVTRNQGNMNGDERYKSRDNTRRIVPVETSDALVVQVNALIVQDGLRYDWSYD